MQLSDIIPAKGQVQRNYCESCNSHLELAFNDFDHVVSDVEITILGLPQLVCPACKRSHLPDLSRYTIVRLHHDTIAAGRRAVHVQRRKRTNDWKRTIVRFDYDPDDYFYIPGLYRSFDEGFLQPVFFKRRALMKYDNLPGYRVKFASRTYGSIITENNDLIAFGINRHDALVMWLGDIAKLPDAEQYFLRSENIPSDHAIGSEFYDGQIEVRFTDRPPEDELFRARSEFLAACQSRFGASFGHLDVAVHALALRFNPPSVDTPKERRHVADTLNKIYLESLDNAALAKALTAAGVTIKATGNLKRLEALLGTVGASPDIHALMSPFYVLYDLRVAYSHISSTGDDTLPDNVYERLELPTGSNLSGLYDRLVERMIASYDALTLLLLQ